MSLAESNCNCKLEIKAINETMCLLLVVVLDKVYSNSCWSGPGLRRIELETPYFNLLDSANIPMYVNVIPLPLPLD